LPTDPSSWWISTGGMTFIWEKWSTDCISSFVHLVTMVALHSDFGLHLLSCTAAVSTTTAIESHYPNTYFTMFINARTNTHTLQSS
jgi:hypothetical protein